MVNQYWRLDCSRQLSRHLHTVRVCIPVVDEFSLLKNHTNELNSLHVKENTVIFLPATIPRFWPYVFTLILGDKNVLKICDVF